MFIRVHAVYAHTVVDLHQKGGGISEILVIKLVCMYINSSNFAASKGGNREGLTIL